MRLIDANMAQHIANTELSAEEAGIVQWVLSHTPTAEAAPVVHGSWLRQTPFVSRCSVCAELSTENGHYCPNCGAKMDEERRMSSWISVNDRLPEKRGEYLVAYRPRYWDRVSIEIEVFLGGTTWAHKDYMSITHWMPLPEPPEVEK